MENFFIKSKHWQVFLLFLVTFIVVQIIFVLTLSYSEDTIFTGFLTGIGAAGSYALLLSWYYFLIRGLNKKIKDKSLKTMKKGIWFIICYPTLYLFLFFLVFPTGFVITTEDSSQFSLIWMMVIFPFHILAIFCFYYLLFLTAKTIKVADKQRKATFVEFAGEFFLLWFFPIGIWFLQPEINKIASQKD